MNTASSFAISESALGHSLHVTFDDTRLEAALTRRDAQRLRRAWGTPAALDVAADVLNRAMRDGETGDPVWRVRVVRGDVSVLTLEC